MVHLRQLGRVAIVTILLATTSLQIAFAQAASLDPSSIKRTKDLFLRANGLPIEYRAEIQLDVMEAASVPVVRKYLPDLKDLYSNLGSVQYQFPHEYGIQFSQTQSKEYWILSGLVGAKLDALSLRLRLLRLISHVDPTWATGEYKRLPLLISRTDCSSVLVPTADQYIAAAPEFLKWAPAGSQENYEWLQDFIAHLPSPILLSPTAALLSATDMPADSADALVRQYELTLAANTATDREAGVIFQKQQFVDVIKTLSNNLLSTQRDPFGLLLALRAFIIRSHAEPSCADSVTDWDSVRSAFNLLVVDLKQGQRIKPISDTDFGPKDAASPSIAHSTPMPEQGRIDQLIAGLFHLRASATLSSVGVSSGSSSLQEVTEAIIAQTNDINPSRFECVECAAFYKSLVLLQAADLAPQSPQKDLLTRLAVNSVAANENQYSSPVLWLPLTKLLLNQTRQVSPEDKKTLSLQLQINQGFIPFGPTPSGSDIRREMAATGNPIFISYLQADELTHHPFWSPYLDASK
jgi:hypothetical protein